MNDCRCALLAAVGKPATPPATHTTCRRGTEREGGERQKNLTPESPHFFFTSGALQALIVRVTCWQLLGYFHFSIGGGGGHGQCAHLCVRARVSVCVCAHRDGTQPCAIQRAEEKSKRAPGRGRNDMPSCK